MKANLNSEQIKAVQYTNGPLVIIAGPGTGKTKTLVEKIRYLIKNTKANPQHILGLTFTNKAATEINKRLQISVNTEKLNSTPLIKTFHGLAYDILSQKNKLINIISQKEKKEIIQKIKKDFPEYKNISFRDIEQKISSNKISQNNDSEDFDEVFNIYTQYQKELSNRNLLDYDDLLVNAYSYLNKNKLNIPRPKYVLIDEFQDTSPLQYKLVKLLIGDNENITIIGDPWQSIYGFRGATKNIFSLFQKEYPTTKTIKLKINYRSDKNIISVSEKLFPKERIQIPYSKQSGTVQLVTTQNEFTEADWILAKISQIMGGMDLLEASDYENETIQDNKAKFKDFAIIYRVHGINRILENRFNDNGIPYQIVGGKSLYEQSLIVFIINILKYISLNDWSLLKEILQSSYTKISKRLLRKILDLKRQPQNLFDSEFLQSFKTSLDKIDNFSKSNNLTDLVDLIVLEFKLIPSIKNELKKTKSPQNQINEFKSLLTRFNDLKEKGLSVFLEGLQELVENDYYDKKADRVTLLTMHAAKGLEFKYVFIAGFEEGLIPFTKKDTDLNEEKRLLYVAMTRAKNHLYLLKSKFRNKEKTKSSQFEKLIKLDKLMIITDPIISKLDRKKRIAKEKKSQVGMGF